MPSYLVVGGGISGLAAAEALLSADPSAQVTVLEGSDRVGGKIRGEPVAGRTVDVGAEAVLARRPEALDLIERAGLGDQVVHPTAARAQVWSRGVVHPLPARTMMGVPADPESLRGLLTDDEVARARDERVLPLTAPDVSVADLVSERLGTAVTERLVEPLLGGVWAGHARLLSARAALPALVAAAERGESLTRASSRLLPAPGDGTQTRSATPVFATVRGGLHRLPETLAARLTERGVVIRTGTMVRELHRLPDGALEVVTGPRPDPTAYRAGRVVLAVPPAPTARLISGVVPEAARLLGGVETASTAVLTFAFPTQQLGALPGSGFLVPPVDGRTAKAATFSTSKWDWVRELGEGAGPNGADLTFLRVSVGRHREELTLQVPDGELVRLALADLAAALQDLDPGRPPLPVPVHVHVQRWGGGLPQYAVGHVDLVARVRVEVAQVSGVAVCGATYDGVGIPACIASARRAVAELVAAAATMGP